MYVWYKDAAGNVSSTASDSITLDTTAPAIISKSPASGATGVALTSAISAAFSESMKSSTITNSTFTVNNGVTNIGGSISYSGVTATFAPSSVLSSYTTYTVTVTTEVTDAAGNAMAANAVWSFTTADTTAPGGSVTINGNAAEITSTTATLNLTATDAAGVAGYYASESSATPLSGDAGWTSVAATVSYSANVSFTLSNGDGVKTVYVWYKDAAGNVSGAASDAITLKELPVAAKFKINNDAMETSSCTVSLNNTATGNPTHYMASEFANFADAGWHTYSTAPDFTLVNAQTYAAKQRRTKSAEDGVKTVYFKVKNGNGESGVVSDNITLRELAVVSSFLINNGSAETSSRKITLNNTATGSPTHYKASEFENFTDAAWQAYHTTPAFILSEGDGAKTVYFKVKNAAGESAVVNDTIILKKAQNAFVADAGIDQLARRGSVVTLDGSRSFNAEGNVPLTYEWSFISLPQGTGSLLSDFQSVNPVFTVKKQGNYEIQIIVKDSRGAASEPDTVIVSTRDTTPVAHAGGDQLVRETGTRITLDGSQSYDPDGDPLFYQWAFVSKPAESIASLEGAYLARPAFVADVPGEYVIRLTVTDGQSHRASDTVSVGFGNVRPVANAGKSLSVKVGDTVTLSGDGTDANGDTLHYRWALSSLPNGSLSKVADS